MKKITDTRKVVLDSWYTTAQIENLGNHWQSESANRLFLTADAVLLEEMVAGLEQRSIGEPSAFLDNVAGQTGLRKKHVEQISEFPFHMMLLLNLCRNHWTSITIAVSKIEFTQKFEIKMSFSDSMGGASIPFEVNNEMDRIEALFKDKFSAENTVFSREVYQYAWRQEDGCSCGPYSIINAQRCLAGIKKEDNPGRKRIREAQLNQMTSLEAIKGCSTNNKIDLILEHWIIKSLSSGQSYEYDSSPQWLENMVKSYALANHQSFIETQRIIIDEYNYTERAPKYLMKRMRELLSQPDFFKKTIQSNLLDPHLKQLRRENIMVRLEKIRNIIEKETGDFLQSYVFIVEIIDCMKNVNLNKIVDSLEEVIKQPVDLNACLHEICVALGSREIEKDYADKLSQLGRSYSRIHQAGIAIIQAAQSIDPDNIYNLQTAKYLFEEQISLLNKAISRNDASLIRHVAYLISDFCSSIVEIITLGWWKPDYRRIEEINKRLNPEHPEHLDMTIYARKCQTYQQLLNQIEECEQIQITP